MTLLSDLLAEEHSDLLERGNLSRKPLQKAPFTPRWAFAGYVACVTHNECACGSEQKTLQGIFQLETAPSGERRMIKADVYNTGPKILEETHTQSKVCPSCLTGFSPQS